MFARIMVVAVVAVFGWTAFVHPLGAHGPKRDYVVKPYDTLWSIASAHYAGDVRDAIYRIQQANELRGGVIRPGEVLVLP